MTTDESTTTEAAKAAEATHYAVVVNDEQQYSIWRADAELPPGWHAEGTKGPQDECLAHIDQVWTDMRPLSLRLAMERSGANTL